MSELLPPAVQQMVVDASGAVAGIDVEIAAMEKLSGTIAAVSAEAKTMEATLASAGAGGAAIGAGADVGALDASAAAAARAAAEQTGLSEAERMAAEGARLEAQMSADLVREQTLVRDSSLAAAQAQTAVRDAYMATSTAVVRVTDAQKVAITRSAEAEAAAAKNAATQKELAGTLGKVGTAAIVTAGAFVGYGVKSAADYEQQIMRLKTAAGATGELIGGKFTGELKMASDGLLKVSVDTGTSTSELTKGMYMVMSAGFHGADAMKVLTTAAEGARAENASLGDTTKALTTLLNDFYHGQTDKVVPAMNMMITTVAQGKMTMQDLASSMASVLPVAANNKISFAEVGAAISTLTAHGQTADLATQHLSNTIRNLANPSNVASTEMGRLGLSANDVAKNLQDATHDGGGLYGTLVMLQDAIISKMGPAGMVLTSALNKTKDATVAARTEIAQMSPQLRTLAQQYQAGTIGQKDFVKATQNMQGGQANLAKQFMSTINKADGFAQALRNNKPLAETVNAAWQKMTGGATGLDTVLNLTGKNMDYFAKASSKMVAASMTGGKHVENWASIQKTFNFQVSQMEMQLRRAAIVVGQDLIPKLTTMFKFFTEHATVTKMILGIVAAFVAMAVAVKAVLVVEKFVEIVKLIKSWEIATKLLAAAQWLLDAAMNANPLGLIIIAIVAVVAAVIYAWNHWKGFRDFLIGAWHVIAAAGVGLWHLLEGAWHGIAAAALWLWHSIIKPWAAGLMAEWRLIAAVVMWWWHTIVEPAFHAVSVVVMGLWNNWIKPAFGFIAAEFRLVAAVVMWWWHNVMEPAYKAVGAVIMWLWNNVIKPAFGFIKAEFRLVATVVMWWWHNIVEPAFRGVGTVISWLYNNVIKPTFGFISSAVHTVGGVFSWLWKNGIKPAFDGISSAISGAWNFINGIFNAMVGAVRWVGNEISRVMGWVGRTINAASGGISAVSHMLGFADGGPVPGPAGAPQLAVVHGGEYVLSQEMIANITGSGSNNPTDALSSTQVAVASSPPQTGGGGGSVIVVNTYVNGSLLTQRELEKNIRTAVLQTNIRNPTNQLSLPAGR